MDLFSFLRELSTSIPSFPQPLFRNRHANHRSSLLHFTDHTGNRASAFFKHSISRSQTREFDDRRTGISKTHWFWNIKVVAAEQDVYSDGQFELYCSRDFRGLRALIWSRSFLYRYPQSKLKLILSLGVMFYELICGSLPYGDDENDPIKVYQAIMCMRV